MRQLLPVLIGESKEPHRLEDGKAITREKRTFIAIVIQVDSKLKRYVIISYKRDKYDSYRLNFKRNSIFGGIF